MRYVSGVVDSRNSYMTSLGSQLTTYNDTVFSGLETYANSIQTASVNRERSHSAADRSYSISSITAENSYTQKQFESQKTRDLAHVDAAIKELTDTSAKELAEKAKEAIASELAANESLELIDTIFEDYVPVLEEEEPQDPNNPSDPEDEEPEIPEAWRGDFTTAMGGVSNKRTTEVQNKLGRKTASNTVIANAKTQYAEEKKSSQKLADDEYKTASDAADNGYEAELLGHHTTYLNAFATGNGAYRSEISTAFEQYFISTIFNDSTAGAGVASATVGYKSHLGLNPTENVSSSQNSSLVSSIEVIRYIANSIADAVTPDISEMINNDSASFEHVKPEKSRPLLFDLNLAPQEPGLPPSPSQHNNRIELPLSFDKINSHNDNLLWTRDIDKFDEITDTLLMQIYIEGGVIGAPGLGVKNLRKPYIELRSSPKFSSHSTIQQLLFLAMNNESQKYDIPNDGKWHRITIYDDVNIAKVHAQIQEKGNGKWTNPSMSDGDSLESYSWWIGSFEEFYVRGSFDVKYVETENPENSKDFLIFKIRDLEWSLVDTIDANSFVESYNSGQLFNDPLSFLAGAVEGLVDIVGDNFLNAHYHIKIYGRQFSPLTGHSDTHYR